MASWFSGFKDAAAKPAECVKETAVKPIVAAKKTIKQDDDKAKKKKITLNDDDDDDVRPVLVSRVWDVKISKRGLGLGLGKLLIHQKRRISIDIIREPGQDPAKKALLRGESFTKHSENEVLEQGDKVLLRILRRTYHGGEKDEDSSDSEDDDSSVSSIGDHGNDPGWVEMRRQRLDGVEILKVHHNNTIDVKWGKHHKRVRQVEFSSKDDANSFNSVFTSLKTKANTRSKVQLEKFRQTQQPKEQRSRGFGDEQDEEEEEDIKILIEVVSGIDLPSSDGVDASDAYVIIRLGDREIHRTRHIPNTIDPIWTVKTGSLCLLKATPTEFFNAGSGLNFIVMDLDTASKDDTLGTLDISHDELMKRTGERMEYKLVPRHPEKGKKSKLVVRYRPATPKDEKFIATLKKTQNKRGVYAATTQVQPKLTKVNLMKRETKRGSDGIILHRVKPEPDPERTEETTWMSEAMINKESLKPSQKWIEAGSGQLGKLHLEIISCDGLPNKDSGTIGGGKTDAFACVIFEDCIVNTEVINDINSPRWMPWTQRAFVLNIMHPSSQVFVGLFDYDASTVVGSHDPIARVTIDTTNLHPKTEHMLYYNLYTSAVVTKRKNYGRLTVRLRLEWNDERKMLLSTLSPRPHQYVNVLRKEERMIGNYTVNGKYDVNRFDTDIMASYADELKSYQIAVEIIKEALFTVLLWRGHFPLNLRVLRCPPGRGADGATGFWNRITKSVQVKLPLHSVTLFCGGILLVENFDLFPSFFLFTVAWFFLSTMGHQRHHPSPWHHCPSYLELFRALVLNGYPPATIRPDENIDGIEKYNAEVERKIQMRKEAEEKLKKEREQEEAEADEEIEDVDEGKIMGIDNGKGFSVNPLKPLLFPLQQKLGKACVALRVVRSVVLWEDSICTFWIVTACLVLGVPLLFVPWGFILHWLMRITVWVVLGPWMKLVDIFYFRKDKTISTEEEDEKKREELKAKYKKKLEAATHSQVAKENAVKLRDMRKYMFGDYVVRIPRFKQARHVDYPLPKSSATPFRAGDSEEEILFDRKVGQYLVGEMILSSEEKESDEQTQTHLRNSQGYGTMKARSEGDDKEHGKPAWFKPRLGLLGKHLKQS